MKRWFGFILIGAAVLLAAGHEASADDWSEVAGGDPASNMVALTFDAGGVAGWPVSAILDTLRDRSIRQTFFLSGHWVESYPDLAQRVADEGHETSNHTYYHPDLTRLSRQQIEWELVYTDHIIQMYTGKSSKPYFRPPFGARNRVVWDVAAESGFRSIYWTLDSGDWLAGATPARVASKVLNNVSGGDIVVMHVAAEATGSGLPGIIDAIQARGLRLVTVSEMLGQGS